MAVNKHVFDTEMGVELEKIKDGVGSYLKPNYIECKVPASKGKASYLHLTVANPQANENNNVVRQYGIGVNDFENIVMEQIWSGKTAQDISSIYFDDGPKNVQKTFLVDTLFTRSPRPSSQNDDTNLGSHSHHWNRVYAGSIGHAAKEFTIVPAKWRDGGVGYGDYVFDDGYIYPSASGKPTLGTSAFRWSAVHTVNGTTTSSDRRMKTNIVSIGNSDVMSISKDNTLTKQDFYNFVKDINFYSWDWKEGNMDGLETNLGIMADELNETTIGKLIVLPSEYDERTKSTSMLSINDRNMNMSLAIALQEAINKIENLENELNLLKNN